VSAASTTTVQLQGCIDRLNTGDAAALDGLIAHAYERLERLAQRMLRDFPRLRDWESTGDVLHNAYPRLRSALQAVPLTSVRDFLGLATLQIRRELLDLARHYFGPEGSGARRASPGTPDNPESTPHAQEEKADTTNEPARLLDWTEFHQQVEALPVPEREVFSLLWYHGMTQPEAAGVLNVSEATLRRRWLKARLMLQESLQGEMPGI